MESMRVVRLCYYLSYLRIYNNIDYDYKIGDKVLVINEGILRKAESAYGNKPWTITTVHMNRTIRIQGGTKTERLSIWRVEPFTDDIL